MSGIIKLVGKADSGRYKTIRQVADLVNRDPSTVRQAIRDGRINDLEGNVYEGPTHRMPLGDGKSGSFVWLYTDDDITILRAHFKRVPIRRVHPAS